MAGRRAVCIVCLAVWGAIVYVFEIVCVVVDAEILVSVVVSIPACYAGDPCSIPGREAFTLCYLLSALKLTPDVILCAVW